MERLLCDLFSERELRTFLRDLPGGVDLVDSLPENAPLASLSQRTVEILRSRGRLDRGFFRRLAQARPLRADDIGRAALAWGQADGPPDAGDTFVYVTSEAFARSAIVGRPPSAPVARVLEDLKLRWNLPSRLGEAVGVEYRYRLLHGGRRLAAQGTFEEQQVPSGARLVLEVELRPFAQSDPVEGNTYRHPGLEEQALQEAMAQGWALYLERLTAQDLR